MAPIQEDTKFNLSISNIYVAINHIFSIFINGETEGQNWLMSYLKLPYMYQCFLEENLYVLKNYIGKNPSSIILSI